MRQDFHTPLISDRILEEQEIQKDQSGVQTNLENRWSSLRDKYLSHQKSDSIWCFSRPPIGLPIQGWKLHISATILCACEVFELLLPRLIRDKVVYKGPSSLNELKKINCGLFYGYSQIGKFLTIYCRNEKEFLSLSKSFILKLQAFEGPAVPSDLPVPGSRCVYYRFGAFRAPHKTGKTSPGWIFDPRGKRIQDYRARKHAVPKWIQDPFLSERTARLSRFSVKSSPLLLRYRAFKALSQRGKGGVYVCLDLGITRCSLRVLKEGRRFGEQDWEGLDGYMRVKNESKMLKLLRAKGLSVPSLIDEFDTDNCTYCVQDYLYGLSLQRIAPTFRRLKQRTEVLLPVIRKMVEELEKLHALQVAWRDLKPANIFATIDRRIVFLDLEGACTNAKACTDAWGSQGYVPPEWLAPRDLATIQKQDIYAFGVTCIQLLLGRKVPVNNLRLLDSLVSWLPWSIICNLQSCLSTDPSLRPTSTQLRLTFTSLVSEEIGESFWRQVTNLFRTTPILGQLTVDDKNPNPPLLG